MAFFKFFYCFGGGFCTRNRTHWHKIYLIPKIFQLARILLLVIQQGISGLENWFHQEVVYLELTTYITTGVLLADQSLAASSSAVTIQVALIIIMENWVS
jgi:hypothetical protein